MSDAKIRAHYQQLYRQHGDSVEAAQWSSRETQERRFEFLARIDVLEGRSVLDFGCGSGHLASWLQARGTTVRYTGVDLVEELLAAGRAKHPQHRFCSFDDVAHERFDYVLISGVFNNRRPGNRRFWQDTVRRLFAMSERGLAFNLLNRYVDYRDAGLFYEAPETVFRFIKREVSPLVTVRNDYEIKPGVVPFEFTTYVYRRPPS